VEFYTDVILAYYENLVLQQAEVQGSGNKKEVWTHFLKYTHKVHKQPGIVVLLLRIVFFMVLPPVTLLLLLSSLLHININISNIHYNGKNKNKYYRILYKEKLNYLFIKQSLVVHGQHRFCHLKINKKTRNEQHIKNIYMQILKIIYNTAF
jgi:hypothetical protein